MKVVDGSNLRLKTTQIKVAVQMYRDGHSARQIAAHLQVGKGAVLNALAFAQVKRRHCHDGMRMYYQKKWWPDSPAARGATVDSARPTLCEPFPMCSRPHEQGNP